MFEMLMVVLIIAIISGVSMVAVSNAMRGLRLSGAADKLATDVRFAQAMAGETGVWYGISFEADPLAVPLRYRRYYVYTTTGTQDTAIANPAKTGSNFIIDLVSDYSIDISSVNIDGGTKVEFSPLGTPYRDRLGAAVSAEGVVTLRKDSTTRTVRIVPNTGRVYIQ